MTFSPTPHTAQERKERIEATVILTKNGRPRSLYERMADYTIPGVSIAIINDYHLEWACGYGVHKSGEPERVDRETLFQACSISKAVAAIAVLRLVEEARREQPANTPEIRVTTIPGMRFRYSGGGYCVLQQLLMDVMKQPFPELICRGI